MGGYQICVSTGQKTLCVYSQTGMDGCTVLDVKKLLAEVEGGAPVEKQKLIFYGQVLDDEK